MFRKMQEKGAKLCIALVLVLVGALTSNVGLIAMGAKDVVSASVALKSEDAPAGAEQGD